MFTIRIAQLNISIDNKYEYLPDMCRDYITDEKAMIKQRNFKKLFDSQEMEEDKKRICFVDMDKDIAMIKKEIFGGMDY